MRGTLLPDGRITYPHRGDPPKPPDGYMTDPGDPFILVPVYEPCVFRILRQFTMPCGLLGARHHCTFHQKDIKPPDCDFCPDQKEKLDD